MIYFSVYIIWICFMSLFALLAMGDDKRRAIRGKRRTPEARLFLFAFLGGGVGGWLGMYMFRHKTLHKKFVIGFPFIAIAQVLGAVYLYIMA